MPYCPSPKSLAYGVSRERFFLNNTCCKKNAAKKNTTIIFLVIFLWVFIITGCSNKNKKPDKSAAPHLSTPISADLSADMNKGFLLIEQGKPDEAVSFFNEVLQQHPHNYKAYYGLFLSYYALKDIEAAEAALFKAYKLNPQDIEILNEMGLTYFRKGEYDKSASFFNDAINIDPAYAFTYGNYGFLLFNDEKYQDALEYYNKAVSLDPFEASFYFGRGKTYIKLNKNLQAFEDFDKAISLDENHYEALHERGLFYVDTLRYEKAVEDLTGALNSPCRAANSFFERGIVFYWMGDFQQAYEDFNSSEKLLIEKKDDLKSETKIGLMLMKGLALSKLGREDEAKTLIEEGVELFQNQEEFDGDFYRPAYGCLFLNRYDQALYFFNMEPDTNKHKYYGRGLAYYKLGKTDKAKMDLEYAVKVLPPSWEKEEALKLYSKIISQE